MCQPILQLMLIVGRWPEGRKGFTVNLVNLGNILYLKRDLSGALALFSEAAGSEPDNPTVLLNIARINHEMENYGNVQKSYQRLAVVAPELAEEFKYLSLRGDEAARAADAGGLKEVMVWEEQ